MKRKQVDPESAVGYNSTSIHNRIFTPSMENDLVAHMSNLAKMFYGLSLEKCKKLAFEFAIKHKLIIPDS